LTHYFLFERLMATEKGDPPMTQPKSQTVRGTQDLISAEADLHRFIETSSYAHTQLYGYQEMRTPIFEYSEVFHRTLGDSSDAVTKETYTFLDRGGDSLTLRPEGTAPIVRALLSNGLTHELPLKYYYSGPMFRYERPQKGRLRQFHQIGVEFLGALEPWSDVETILCASELLNKWGLSEHITLELNTLGDKQSRALHLQKLVGYLEKYENDLSEDSKIRLKKNPLRILDSKSESDQKLLDHAPSLEECLTPASKDYFNKVTEGLTHLNIPFKLSPRLVRGFDYYSHTVFEFTTTLLGAQSAVLSGGRYNDLVEVMGGNSTPAIGWAAGVERLTLLLKQIQNTPQVKSTDIFVLPMSDDEISISQGLARKLRNQNISAELLTSGKIGKRIQKADKAEAKWIALMGDNENKTHTVTLKNLKSGEQVTLPQDQMINHIKEGST